MKTEKEIKEYLENKVWYKEFVKNTINQLPKEINGYLHQVISGKNGRGTISSAFTWSLTEEGREYWEEIAKKFISWYDDTICFKDLKAGELFIKDSTNYIKINDKICVNYYYCESLNPDEIVKKQ